MLLTLIVIGFLALLTAGYLVWCRITQRTQPPGRHRLGVRVRQYEEAGRRRAA